MRRWPTRRPCPSCGSCRPVRRTSYGGGVGVWRSGRSGVWRSGVGAGRRTGTVLTPERRGLGALSTDLLWTGSIKSWSDAATSSGDAFSERRCSDCLHLFGPGIPGNERPLGGVSAARMTLSSGHAPSDSESCIHASHVRGVCACLWRGSASGVEPRVHTQCVVTGCRHCGSVREGGCMPRRVFSEQVEHTKKRHTTDHLVAFAVDIDG